MKQAFSLEVIGMSKRFGDLIALDDVTLKIKAGTVHALLGENGAGIIDLGQMYHGFLSP